MAHHRVFQRSALAALVVLALAFSASAFLVAEREPDGSYCGSYAVGLVRGRMDIRKSQGLFDINVTGLGISLVCDNETYKYDPKTHTADIPGARDPNDCVGKALEENQVNATVRYNPKDDVVVLDLEFTHIDCKKCE